MTSLRLKFTAATGVVAMLLLVWSFAVLTDGFQLLLEDRDEADMMVKAQLVASVWEQAGGCAAAPAIALERLNPEMELASALSIFAYCDGKLVGRYGTIAPPPDGAGLELPDYEDDSIHLRYHAYPVEAGRIVLTSEHPEPGEFFIATVLTRLIWPLLGLVGACVLLWHRSGVWFRPVQSLAEGRPGESPVDCPVELLPLQQKIMALEVEYAAVVDKLDARLEGEKQFTANAAHELLTPLAAIKTEVQLQRSLARDDDTRAVFDEIGTRVDRASHTVDQLMTLARLDPENQRTEPGPLDLAALLRESVAGTGDRLAAKTIRLSADIPDALPFRGHGDALRIMFKNLLDNAVRYSPDGGRLEIALTRAPDGVRFRIANDCRQRVPQYLVEHMDQRFVRGAGEVETGTGLGMSIITRCAHMHGAEVIITPSPDNMQLTFCVVFPDQDQG
ncbi:MAG: hypothetical protein CSA74_01220 [Rhodobacterales bacterium]|nr:MAG: hypothetical protein CSA74_01220 [Rhodobacterales bacterium]